MSVIWRRARRADVPLIVEMLADDMLGKAREGGDLTPYFAAFDAIDTEGGSQLIVGEKDGTVVATYQLTMILGLSLKATRRAQIEGVRVAAEWRGKGIGAALMADAEMRARAGGCGLLQFTSNKARDRAHAFYERLGFQGTHVGFKKPLQ